MNGKILILTNDLLVDVSNSNIGLGFGLFETIKIVNKKPINLNKHLKRLDNSLNFFKLGRLPKFSEVRHYLDNFLAQNETEHHALKLIAIDNKLICFLRKYNVPEKPVSICISEKVRFSQNPLLNHKTTSYFFNKLLMEEAFKKESYDSIVFNELGNLTEGGKTNVFVVKNGNIYTSKISDGCLPGVMRDEVVSNFNVNIRSLNKDFVISADEVFLTNSLIGILSIEQIVGYDKNFKTKITENLKKKL